MARGTMARSLPPPGRQLLTRAAATPTSMGMDQTAPNLPALRPAPPAASEIARLAARYRAAGGGILTLVTGFGGRVETRLKALPAPLRHRLDALAHAALTRSYGLAARGGTRLPGGHVALASLGGALGGAAGLPGAIAELPATVTLILHAIQNSARQHGFDPESDAIRRESLRVFGAGSPLAADDGVDTAFIGARLTLTGPALHGMLTAVAPRLATALGPKLAAQSVPVLGAIAGAGLNAAYMQYYRDMADIRFGLLALARRHDPAAVMAAFRTETARRC